MLPSGLSMLWEDSSAATALADRFGFASMPDAERWVGALLADRWHLEHATCERIVISDHKAIVWVRVQGRPLIVKLASAVPAFGRLAAVAELLTALAAAGIRTPAPLPAADGSASVEAEQGHRRLSVLVQPLVEGELLDVGDLAAVHATGAEVGRLHAVLAETVAGPLGVPGRGAGTPLRDRALRDGPLRETGWPDEVAPTARRRLETLVGSLPDIDEPVQLTHGDIRSANVLVRDHQVTGLLDFDEVGMDHRIVDIGRGAALLATRFRQWGPAPVQAQVALVAGYRSAVDLSPVELGWLEAIMLWHMLVFIPPGADPAGWADAADQLAASASLRDVLA